MKINKQLFEDVLLGKVKGAFILRNGVKIPSERFSRNMNSQQQKTYPYISLRRVPYLNPRTNIEECAIYNSYTNTGKLSIYSKSELDIIDFESEMNTETKIQKQ